MAVGRVTVDATDRRLRCSGKPVVSRRHLYATGTALAPAFFALLIVVDVIRTLRHAMWRDELETFGIAASSPSLWTLWLNLKYEGHPAVWYVLVWLITRATSDPIWMQVLHIGLAITVWSIIYLWSPFGRLEKILLLLSYFLFFEYFVISRSYVLIALIAFSFIVLRERPSRPQFPLWLLLGLLANVHMLGAIWSMVLAVMLAIDDMRRRSVPVAAAAVYLILLAFAVWTMQPPPEFALSSPVIGFDIARLNADLTTPIGAFMPLSLSSIRGAIAFIAHPGTASIPDYSNVTAVRDIVGFAQTDTGHPIRLALVYAAPIFACWLVTRNPLLALEFALVYLGIVLFENIWNFPGVDRHHGIVFLAMIAAAWSARSRRSATIWQRWIFAAILIVNACAGVLTLASELRPFSEGYDTASWIRQNNLENAFLIGSHDAQVSSVVGYLGRPVYYLECECYAPMGIWDENRVGRLSAEEFAARLAKAVALAAGRDAILVRDRPVTPNDLKPAASNISATLLKSFTNAMTDENFWIYRLNAQQAP
jgi:hypothetical protein